MDNFGNSLYSGDHFSYNFCSIWIVLNVRFDVSIDRNHDVLSPSSNCIIGWKIWAIYVYINHFDATEIVPTLVMVSNWKPNRQDCMSRPRTELAKNRAVDKQHCRYLGWNSSGMIHKPNGLWTTDLMFVKI